MGDKSKIDPTNTYVMDKDVMDEMENLEATIVLDDAPKHLTDTDILDDKVLDD